ncbi:MAG: hypothetical protein JWR75_424 [Devosia sp.]|nr:hypothetical protein [Devosia sp.]
MPTRLKKPSIFKQLAITGLLLVFQGYLGFSAIGGQFGTESQKQMKIDINVLSARAFALQADIDAYRHRAALFDVARLDPDIIDERARALLNMAQPDDILVMLNPATGLPISSSFDKLAQSQLTDIIVDAVE